MDKQSPGQEPLWDDATQAGMTVPLAPSPKRYDAERLTISDINDVVARFRRLRTPAVMVHDQATADDLTEALPRLDVYVNAIVDKGVAFIIWGRLTDTPQVP